MQKYINFKFNCNEYFLIANLLTKSVKIQNILNGKDYEGLDSINVEDKSLLAKEFDEFVDIAKEYPQISHLLNFETDFDKLQPEQYEAYNDKIFTEVESYIKVKTDEQLEKLKGINTLDAFKKLQNTDFFKSILQKTIEHKENLENGLNQYIAKAERILDPTLSNMESKNMEVVVLPPELFDTQYAADSIGKNVISVASYPEYFDKEIPNLKTVSMIHEMMHTYIPLDKKAKFGNEKQELVYNVVNHCLVELSSNCELGKEICGVNGYFDIPMHNEILKNSFRDTEGIKREEYLKCGITFPEEFLFESKTEYSKAFGGKTVTPKDELSNDKIRGIVYPYFLAFKNRNKENPIQDTIDQMREDKESIIKIYGQNFYEKITNPEYLKDTINATKDCKNLLELNDTIAKDAFEIEIQRDKKIQPQEIGKATINIPTEEKDKTKEQIQKDERQIKHIQENQYIEQ